MASEVFEIIELEDGDLALRKEDQKEGTYLIRIEFSSAMKSFIKDGTLSIAQAMLKAGIQQFYRDIDNGEVEELEPNHVSNLLH